MGTQQVTRDCAEELPGAELTFPFGPDTEVYKVRGKVFALLSLWQGKPIVTLKADPQDARLLVSEYTQIIPGYHMNKKHWITLLPDLESQLVEDLVTESYLTVVATLPRARRPIDPTSWGQ